MKPSELIDIAGLSCFAGSEIDDGILGRNNEGYECCERVAEKLKICADDWMSYPCFALDFYRVVGSNAGDIREIIPEMKFVALELRHVRELPKKRQEYLRGFCVDLSRQLISKDSYGPSFLVA